MLQAPCVVRCIATSLLELHISLAILVGSPCTSPGSKKVCLCGGKGVIRYLDPRHGHPLDGSMPIAGYRRLSEARCGLWARACCNHMRAHVSEVIDAARAADAPVVACRVLSAVVHTVR